MDTWSGSLASCVWWRGRIPLPVQTHSHTQKHTVWALFLNSKTSPAPNPNPNPHPDSNLTWFLILNSNLIIMGTCKMSSPQHFVYRKYTHTLWPDFMWLYCVLLRWSVLMIWLIFKGVVSSFLLFNSISAVQLQQRCDSDVWNRLPLICQPYAGKHTSVQRC